MKKPICIIPIIIAVTMPAVKASALETIYVENGNYYISDNGKIYTPAYDDNENWLGYYLDENGYVSHMSTDNYMFTEYPYPNDGTHPEVRYGYYDGYDLFASRGRQPSYIGWLSLPSEKRMVRNPHYSIEWNKESDPRYDYSIARIRIPNSITDELSKTCGYVCSIDGSCAFKEFDLAPENEYMKCVDNVVFSIDGRTLMSFAQYDERSDYYVPSSTEVIARSSFGDCKNLKRIWIPESVKEIKEYAFSGTYNLLEMNFSAFDIEIDRKTFGVLHNGENPIRLTSCLKPEAAAKKNILME